MTRKLLSVIGIGVLAAATLLVGAGSASAASPGGHLDSVSYDFKYQSIYVSGWAGDTDAGTHPVRVHIYVDGKGAAAVSTGLSRADVAKAHPELGANTGFFADVSQPPGRGTHNVCAYAINVGAGSNVLLGCRTVEVTLPGALLGHIDSIKVDPGNPLQRIARGWVLDPNDAWSPTPFALLRTSGPYSTVGGYDGLTGSAGLPRPDVDNVYPKNGHDHGFSVTFAATDVDWLATDRICLAISYFTPGQYGTVTPYCITYTG